MKKFLLVIVSVIIGLLFFKLTDNYSKKFNFTNEAYNKDQCVNLVKGVTTESIEKILLNYNYVSEKKDAQFIANQISQKLNNEGLVLSNLYDLNKRIWQVPATTIDSCYSDSIVNKTTKGKTKEKTNTNTEDLLLKKRLIFSQEKLGIDSTFNALKIDQLKHNMEVGNGGGKITVTVTEEDKNANFIKKALHTNKTECKDVIVRLSVHYIDTTLANNHAKDSILCYAKTDKDGKAVFSKLDPNKSYSVLPIKKGFEYGSPQGTIGGSLSKCKNGNDDSIVCSFKQQEHRIRLFDANTLKVIKEDQTMTVRTPSEFENNLITYLAIYFAMWWALYLFNIRKKRTLDVGILSILMLLTGICILTMFSINDPLTDKLFGGRYGSRSHWWYRNYMVTSTCRLR